MSGPVAVVVDSTSRTLHISSAGDDGLTMTRCGAVLDEVTTGRLAQLLEGATHLCRTCWPDALILPFPPRGVG